MPGCELITELIVLTELPSCRSPDVSRGAGSRQVPSSCIHLCPVALKKGLVVFFFFLIRIHRFISLLNQVTGPLSNSLVAQ